MREWSTAKKVLVIVGALFVAFFIIGLAAGDDEDVDPAPTESTTTTEAPAVDDPEPTPEPVEPDPTEAIADEVAANLEASDSTLRFYDPDYDLLGHILVARAQISDQGDDARRLCGQIASASYSVPGDWTTIEIEGPGGVVATCNVNR